jgi:Domain of unknown function (DUF397)
MNETTDLSHAKWFKSSFSNGQGGNCVEAAINPPGSGMAVRDSKHPASPVLLFSANKWRAFTERIKLSEPR